MNCILTHPLDLFFLSDNLESTLALWSTDPSNSRVAKINKFIFIILPKLTCLKCYKTKRISYGQSL